MNITFKNKKTEIVLGVILGLLNGLGFMVKKSGGFELRYVYVLLISVLLFIGISIAVFAVFSFEKKQKSYIINDLIKSRMIYFCIVVSLLILCWIPTFLALFPGLFNYDAGIQIGQYLSHAITEHHPVVHTILMGKAFSAGRRIFENFNMGMMFISIF